MWKTIAICAAGSVGVGLLIAAISAVAVLLASRLLGAVSC